MLEREENAWKKDFRSSADDGGTRKTKAVLRKPGYGKHDLDTGLTNDEKIQVRQSTKSSKNRKAGDKFK